MDGLLSILGALILGIFTLIFAKKACKKKAGSLAQPKNTAAEAAREAVQQTFEEEVSRIEEAKDGDDAASALAALGNARKR